MPEKMYPPPVKNPYHMPLILTTFDLSTEEVKSRSFGWENQWEPRWDKQVKQHPNLFHTLWSPFYDSEAGHTVYLKLICDCESYRKTAFEEIDWDVLIAEAKSNAEEEDGQMVGCAFLATVFDLMPSGKFYMPWANGNVTADEAGRDEIFMEHLERAATEHGGSIEGGEGDPTDLYFVMVLDTSEEVE